MRYDGDNSGGDMVLMIDDGTVDGVVKMVLIDDGTVDGGGNDGTCTALLTT